MAELQPLRPPSKKNAFRFGCLKSVGRVDLCIQGQRPHRSTRLKLWRTGFDVEEYGITRIVSQPSRPTVVPEGRQQSLPSAPSRPQEPRALDLLSPSHFDAIPENVVPEVNMQTDENNPNGDQSQQQVAPDLQPQEVVF